MVGHVDERLPLLDELDGATNLSSLQRLLKPLVQLALGEREADLVGQLVLDGCDRELLLG